MAHAHPFLSQPLHLFLQLAQDVQVGLVLLGVLLQLNHTLVRGLLGNTIPYSQDCLGGQKLQLHDPTPAAPPSTCTCWVDAKEENMAKSTLLPHCPIFSRHKAMTSSLHGAKEPWHSAISAPAQAHQESWTWPQTQHRSGTQLCPEPSDWSDTPSQATSS